MKLSVFIFISSKNGSIFCWEMLFLCLSIRWGPYMFVFLTTIPVSGLQMKIRFFDEWYRIVEVRNNFEYVWWIAGSGEFRFLFLFIIIMVHSEVSTQTRLFRNHFTSKQYPSVPINDRLVYSWNFSSITLGLHLTYILASQILLRTLSFIASPFLTNSLLSTFWWKIQTNNKQQIIYKILSSIGPHELWQNDLL